MCGTCRWQSRESEKGAVFQYLNNAARRARGSDDRGQWAEDSGQRTVVRDQKSGIRGQKSAVRDGGAVNWASISVLPRATAYRLWGALELASRLGPNCSLIFVGSPNGDTRAMTELALLLMPEQNVVSKAHLGGTSEHPKHVEGFVGEKAFYSRHLGNAHEAGHAML